MKRFMAILLISLMTLSVLAGCDRPLNKEVNDGREQLTTTAASAKPTTTTEKKTTKASATNKIFSTPSTQDLVKGYFSVIGNIPKGTAGASLKLAEAAVEVFRFAQDYNLAGCDISALRDNMLNAWQKVLDEEERANFDENFMDVVTFMDSAKADPAAVAAQLEDAGVKDEFEKLANTAGAWDNWDTLKSNTLTMGNSEE
ncbi:MAG: hypothetical protein IJ241_00730 [Clostridia bacterium]|nr:hypothetical protein [Clostridia bacterium]MBQ8924920.1 hypothetical protein [Clostridia bacterium]